MNKQQETQIDTKAQSQKSDQSDQSKLIDDEVDQTDSIEDLYRAESAFQPNQKLIDAAAKFDKPDEIEAFFENTAIRPLRRQESLSKMFPAKLIPLEFTPIFINLIRFSDHGSYQWKFSPAEIQQEMSKPSSQMNFSRLYYPTHVEKLLQDFSQLAKLAEEQLRQPKMFKQPKYTDPEFELYKNKTFAIMDAVKLAFGTEALERPGFLFYHATAIKYESCNFEEDCTKYPTLSLSDNEMYQLVLKSPAIKITGGERGHATSLTGTLYYKTFVIEHGEDPSEYVDAVIGIITQRKPSIQLSQEAIDALATMVQAMTKLQAGLECIVPVQTNSGTSAEFFDQLKAGNKLYLNQIMDNADIQELVEKHKMSILQGLAWLQKFEVRSYLKVLNTLYHVFTSEHHLNQYVLGQVSVLLTGMGLVNIQGRIAFFQAVSQYCATIFELLYHETEAGKATVHRKTIHQPTYGRKITEPEFHKYPLFKLNYYHDQVDVPMALTKAATKFRSMMEVLTSTPQKKVTFTNQDLKDFYRKYAQLENFSFAIRSCAAEGKDSYKSVPAIRVFCFFSSGTTNERLGLNYRPEEIDIDEDTEFSFKRHYLNASRHGGDVCDYKLPFKPNNTPQYQRTTKFFQSEELFSLINGWILQAHVAMRGHGPEVVNRSLEDDLAVLAEYQRVWLVNQDSVCIATSIEQVALNIQCRNKLQIVLWKLKAETANSKLKQQILASTIESVEANMDTNIFFIDQMARALLLYCKIAVHNTHLHLLPHLDMTIFDSHLTFTQDVTIEISSSLSMNSGTPQSKRAIKEMTKQPISPLNTPPANKIASNKRQKTDLNNSPDQNPKQQSETIVPSEQQMQIEETSEEVVQFNKAPTSPQRSRIGCLPDHKHTKDILNMLNDILFDICELITCEPGDGDIAPMRSDYLKYERLEFFSRSQQIFFPLGLISPADQQELIEQIVRYFMLKNCYDLEELYGMSRVDQNSVWYYDKIGAPTQKLDGGNEQQNNKSQIEDPKPTEQQVQVQEGLSQDSYKEKSQSLTSNEKQETLKLPEQVDQSQKKSPVLPHNDAQAAYEKQLEAESKLKKPLAIQKPAAKEPKTNLVDKQKLSRDLSQELRKSNRQKKAQVDYGEDSDEERKKEKKANPQQRNSSSRAQSADVNKTKTKKDSEIKDTKAQKKGKKN